VNHLVFNVRDSFGDFCTHTSNEHGPLNRENDGFSRSVITIPSYDSALTDSASLCFPTGVFATRGQHYAISVRRERPSEKWTF
jgi:hypothetical protein